MQTKTIVFESFTWTDISKPNLEGLRDFDFHMPIDKNYLLDITQSGHLPKVEMKPNYTFFILRGFTNTNKTSKNDIKSFSAKIAIIITANSIFTIHREAFDFLEQCDKPYEHPKALLYHIFTLVLQAYLPPIESLESKIDEMEGLIFLEKNMTLSHKSLYFNKSKARIIKKLLQFHQNLIRHYVEREESYQTHYIDIQDQILSLILKSDEVIEDATALLNTYMSFSAQKSNDIMKLLTVFSAFFLPLTFIVGVYGMNFENMPELAWKYGYFVILGLMVIVALGIYFWFKKKKII